MDPAAQTPGTPPAGATSSVPARPVSAANRFGWDYRAKAAELGPPPVPIVDVHTHVTGPESARVYDEVRRLFGVRLTYTMAALPACGAVRDVLGESVRFIAFPTFMDPDRNRFQRQGYLEAIETFRTEFGSRMMKVWSSPRLRDLVPDLAGRPFGATDLAEVDSPWRVRACELGERLGMMFMIHIADPDTWFRTKYTPPEKYGTKRQQYEGFERMLDRFTAPWIAAHMGGWPEDLGFLDGLLARHPNLHLDTSATKWVIRELGAQPRERVAAFFTKWRGRVLFGSDIVVQEDHLRPQKANVTSPMSDLASSPEGAWELYASRYWALRAMLETGYDGESPIADPDLAMLEPERYSAMSAPRLVGLGLPRDLLVEMYSGAAERVIGAWWGR